MAAAALLAALGIEGSKWLVERRALAALPSAGAGAPNILVIIVDTLRADRLSAYGYTRPTSPRMDAFAREGVLFESAIATSSWTWPSHFSLITGRYPYENSGNLPTVPEVFRSRGYRTGAFSANTIFFTSQKGFGRGFIRFESYFHSWPDRAARTLYGRKIAQFVLRRLGYEDMPGRKLARDVTDAAVRWIGRDPRPFLSYLNYFDVHDPYLPPQPWRNRFAFPGRPNPGGILNAFLAGRYPLMKPEQLQDEIAAYDGAIAYTDHQIGRLLDELDRRGLAPNTIVVITSDHGEMLGEHGLNLHRNCLYREVIHVPLMIRWPERVPTGRRVTQPVSIASIPATLAQLTDASSDSPFPGPSLAPLWQSPTPPSEWPEPLAELEKFPFEEVKREPSYHGAMKSLVSPQWHYIEHEKFGQELFDWINDEAQATNLAATPEGKPTADRFASQLKERISSRRPAPADQSQSARTP
ncbi:MAG: sulfatase [Opitutaceae bacterium]